MSDSISSPFQMRDWQIQSFQYDNPIVSKPNPEAIPSWRFHFHKEFDYRPDSKAYVGIISIGFSVSVPALPPIDDKLFSMSGTVVSLSTLSEEEGDDASAKMDRLLSINATSYTLGALRTFLLQQSALLMREELIVPSINLNKLEFEKDYSL